MSEIISRLAITSALVSSLAIFGCSSSDDGGGTTLTTITEANAAEMVAAATESGMALMPLLDVLTAVEVDQTLSAKDVINAAIDKVKTFDGGYANRPTAVTFSDDCTDGGTVSGDETDTITADTMGVTGTAIFINCEESGITINGSISYSLSLTISTQDYTGAFSGNLSGTDGIESASLTGMDILMSGNDSTGLYSLDPYTFTASVTGVGGFSTRLLAPIMGDENYNCPINPMSGIILVTGASNTQAKGTINSVGNVTIEFNDGTGTFTEVPGSPFPCSDFFI